MIRSLPFGSLVVAAGVVSMLGSSAGCQEDVLPCQRAPVGEINAFEQGVDSSSVFTGVVVEMSPLAENGFRRYRFRESGGAEHVLFYSAPEDSLPVRTGESYEVAVETVPGMPTPCSLVIRDGSGILFVAVSDYRPGDRVLKDGLPGFSVALEEGQCEDRGVNSCLESEVNGLLRVEHADSTVRLFQGDVAALGDFRVRCLTARFVTYSDNCADAGVFGVSYSLERVSPR